MSDPADLQRLLGDLVRYGTIASVDPQTSRIVVKVGNLETGPIRWIASAAGATSHFSAPSVGEQVVLLSPEGDTAAAIAIRGVYSDANPAPGDRAGLTVLKADDGSTFSYDSEAKKLLVQLVAGAKAEIFATGGISITGDVSITGKLSVDGDAAIRGKVDAEGDVVGAGVSLQSHKHGLVKAGTDKSGPPA